MPEEASASLKDQVQDEYYGESFYGEYDFVFVDKLSPGQICSTCLLAIRNAVQTQGAYSFHLFKFHDFPLLFP